MQTLDQKTSQHKEETYGARVKQTKLQLECIEQQLHSRRRELQSVSAAIGEQVRMRNMKRTFVRHLMQTEYLGSLRVQAKRYRKSSRIYLERIHSLQQEIRHHETQLQKRTSLSSALETLNRQIDAARENLQKTLAERDRLAQVMSISFDVYDADVRSVMMTNQEAKELERNREKTEECGHAMANRQPSNMNHPPRELGYEAGDEQVAEDLAVASDADIRQRILRLIEDAKSVSDDGKTQLKEKEQLDTNGLI